MVSSVYYLSDVKGVTLFRIAANTSAGVSGRAVMPTPGRGARAHADRPVPWSAPVENVRLKKN